MATEINTNNLREAFGRFVTGVTIVSYNDASNNPIGLTVNSFASLSMTPPLLSWNIQKESDCFIGALNCDYFAISILRDQQQALARYLSRKDQHRLDQFDGGGHWQKGEYCPIISNSLACFECKSHAQYDGGDHQILVGAIESYHHADKAKPLVFYGGAFTSLNAKA